MYKLVNKYGNAVVETESTVKRDRLIGEGYRLVEDVEENDAAAADETSFVPDDAATPPSERKATDGEDDAASDDGQDLSVTPTTDPENDGTVTAATDGEDDAASDDGQDLSVTPTTDPENDGTVTAATDGEDDAMSDDGVADGEDVNGRSEMPAPTDPLKDAEGDEEETVTSASVSEPETPKETKNKRKSAGTAKKADKE